MSVGVVQSRAAEASPGAISFADLHCATPYMRFPYLPSTVAGPWLRDVVIAPDVEWVDHGIRANNIGSAFAVVDPERAQSPEVMRGDLLFVSLGEAGIYVFDIGNQMMPARSLSEAVGHLWVKDHTAFRLQVEKELGVLLAGGYGGLLDVWNLRSINVAPGVEDHPEPNRRPASAACRGAPTRSRWTSPGLG